MSALHGVGHALRTIEGQRLLSASHGACTQVLPRAHGGDRAFEVGEGQHNDTVG